jgi:hypothetical protein
MVETRQFLRSQPRDLKKQNGKQRSPFSLLFPLHMPDSVHMDSSIGIHRCCSFSEFKAMQSIHESADEARVNAAYEMLIAFIGYMLQILDRNGEIEKCDLIIGVIWCHAP